MRCIVLAASLALAGCAAVLEGAGPARWSPTGASFVAEHAGFEVVPPPGWMRSLLAPGEVLLVTRDGTALQSIMAAATEVGKPLDVGDGKRPVTAGMSPQELAELVMDDVRATEKLTEVRVVESAPATFGGRSGFRVIASFRTSSGLPRRLALYGVLEGARFYRLSYVAPERVYFERDLPTFDAMARSFRLRPPVPEKGSARAARR